MRSQTVRAVVGSALLSLVAQPVAADSQHKHQHRQFHEQHDKNHTHGGDFELIKPRGRLVNRAGQCAFPEDAGLVTVTPHEMNAGWALSPDQECTKGCFCPYACPSGQVMNQWKEGSTYVYPESMDGGLYCDESGEIQKPFPSKDYCVDGVGTINAVNECGKVVAFCQTVLPGNEAMLIPTTVESSAVIAVPDPSYWASTAAHYYINAPGYTTDEACVWGTSAKPIGNWSPYVAGANQDASGSTFVKIGWNPIYTDDYPGVLPDFGVKIECPDGECNGLPCSIDPTTDGYGGVNSKNSATGAGGADYCVVTVTSGKANIVVFNTDGSSGGDDDDDSGISVSISIGLDIGDTVTKSEAPVKAMVAEATTSSSSSSTSVSSSSSPITTSSSSAPPSTTPSSSAMSSTTTLISSSRRSSATQTAASTSRAGIFQESGSNATISSGNAGATITSSAQTADATASSDSSETTSSKSEAHGPKQGQAAFAGLVVAFVVAACLY